LYSMATFWGVSIRTVSINGDLPSGGSGSEPQIHANKDG
jgi:hypothetical protein